MKRYIKASTDQIVSVKDAKKFADKVIEETFYDSCGNELYPLHVDLADDMLVVSGYDSSDCGFYWYSDDEYTHRLHELCDEVGFPKELVEGEIGYEETGGRHGGGMLYAYIKFND